MKDITWIKMYRKFLRWEWYDDINTKSLFLHILLKANYKDKKWHGLLVKRGSFITSIDTLYYELNTKPKTGRMRKNSLITKMMIRTALKHLILTQEITKVSTQEYTIITVNNYEDYQTPNKAPNKAITNHQQTNNKPITTTKERKEEIERKEELQISDENIKTILNVYNQTFNKNITSVKGFERNYFYWKDTYSLETIIKAIKNASLDKFWKDKMTLTILFRQKNTNGEPVDYIGDLSSRVQIPNSGSIGII